MTNKNNGDKNKSIKLYALIYFISLPITMLIGYLIFRNINNDPWYTMFNVFPFWASFIVTVLFYLISKVLNTHPRNFTVFRVLFDPCYKPSKKMIYYSNVWLTHLLISSPFFILLWSQTNSTAKEIQAFAIMSSLIFTLSILTSMKFPSLGIKLVNLMLRSQEHIVKKYPTYHYKGITVERIIKVYKYIFLTASLPSIGFAITLANANNNFIYLILLPSILMLTTYIALTVNKAQHRSNLTEVKDNAKAK